MRAYSNDLRDRVVAACDVGGRSRGEIARSFGVSTAWIRRLLQRRRESGDYGAKPHGGGHPLLFSPKKLERLERLVQQQPDATLAELRQRIGVDCSLMTVANMLTRLGYGRKKRRSKRPSKIGRT
jgi:transposase